LIYFNALQMREVCNFVCIQIKCIETLRILCNFCTPFLTASVIARQLQLRWKPLQGEMILHSLRTPFATCH
jgi:hypothetical protein